MLVLLFFFNDPATTELHTYGHSLSLHDALPFYPPPAYLVDVDLGLFSDALKGKNIRGRVDGSRFVPYYGRAAIERGALADRGLEIAWAADAAEFFFLQIQGSGRLRLPDGSILRIGYDSQNGRDYVGIGKQIGRASCRERVCQYV